MKGLMPTAIATTYMQGSMISAEFASALHQLLLLHLSEDRSLPGQRQSEVVKAQASDYFGFHSLEKSKVSNVKHWESPLLIESAAMGPMELSVTRTVSTLENACKMPQCHIQDKQRVRSFDFPMAFPNSAKSSSATWLSATMVRLVGLSAGEKTTTLPYN